MHPILDYVREQGGDAVDNDNMLVGDIPRFDGYNGRKQWVHFVIMYIPRSSFLNVWQDKHLKMKWNAGYLVGVVHNLEDFKRLVCVYRMWLNCGEPGFFEYVLPNDMLEYQELYGQR